MTLLCDCAVLPNGARLAKRDDAARDSDAQLPLQARWTCEARLARSFAASVLARIPLAVTSDNVSPLTPFRAFFVFG